MPLGWYLAQGLIPLGPSSSDDEEGPCELPDGRVVCGPHGLVYCGRCCTDYTGMGGSDSEEEEEDDADADADDFLHSLDIRPANLANMREMLSLGNRLRRGTGRVFPTKFVPSSATETPMELFTGRRRHIEVTRKVNASSTQNDTNC